MTGNAPQVPLATKTAGPTGGYSDSITFGMQVAGNSTETRTVDVSNGIFDGCQLESEESIDGGGNGDFWMQKIEGEIAGAWTTIWTGDKNFNTWTEFVHTSDQIDRYRFTIANKDGFVGSGNNGYLKVHRVELPTHDHQL